MSIQSKDSITNDAKQSSQSNCVCVREICIYPNGPMLQHACRLTSPRGGHTNEEEGTQSS